MQCVWSDRIDKILAAGHSLQSVGIRNWALDRGAALAALDEFCAQGISVLGGDVYVLRNGTLESTYDNWYCNRMEGEVNADFVSRSIGEARRYIEDYPAKLDPMLFSIVPDI